MFEVSSVAWRGTQTRAHQQWSSMQRLYELMQRAGGIGVHADARAQGMQGEGVQIQGAGVRTQGTWRGGIVTEQRLRELVQHARGVGIDVEARMGRRHRARSATQGEGRGGG